MSDNNSSRGLKNKKYNIKKTLITLLLAFKKTFIWILLSYLIPIINIFLILFIKGPHLTGSMLNIILATNACFIIGAFNLIYNTRRNRESTQALMLCGLVFCVLFFGILTYEIEMEQKNRLPLSIYKYCAAATFIISLILAFISKKDEVEDETNARSIVIESKNTSNVNIKGDNIDIGG
ncbi:hypothetical protein COM33_15610 [Bacillus toyonensis]|uniref:hypothetical protein n=1 Tax=Bacillus TaxID=1386 RepID=UPI0007785743|nr:MULTISPECIES: hypothetical protein [Bacillus]KXY20076.1 hypothetical protein AT259_15340 [Bacillus cereus]MDH8705451.1 peptidoglycan/LPS O-acetylase OafA/YrhL [Stenotrophomonas sp. 1198]MDP9749147.1 peptidoglycan/LPS O-acetylase OafA/YrhL [Bacillus thuringiensis]MDF9888642.1 peptidoglycan/LPS O-acetylase OafA/YrhL [Bacillus sp. LEw-kw-24]MDH6559078.1 peptidoglycan/LPS O-acetylase OafA/YrhL [Bacillus sp. LEw-kw-2]